MSGEQEYVHKLVLVSDKGSVVAPNYETEIDDENDENNIGKCCGCIPLKRGQQCLGIFYTFMVVFLLVMFIRSFILGRFQFEYFVFEILLFIFYLPMCILMMIWHFK